MLWTEFNNNTFVDPWREFERLNRMFSRVSSHRSCEFPAVNLWVDSDHAVVTSEIPGISPEDIEISVVGKSLTLRGTRRVEDIRDNEAYHRRERWNGQFSKTIELPFNVEAGKVNASFKKGVLYITLPRAEEEKPRKIDIKSE
ncbi:MAG: Hsp20/alpha crystallin family protein [Nitrospiraceae bacterium]|nr:MAG: Hsp20/alpha crystallin family protein [Nitrospiraceae bacterium]